MIAFELETVSVPTLILSTNMLLELMKFVKRELVVRLLKVKLFVNWTPLILLTTSVVALTNLVNNELVVTLLKAKLLLSVLPVNS